MKVGIVTITVGINYGNRLQNYALQEVLNKLGVESNTFENIYKEKNIVKQMLRIKQLKEKEKKFFLKLEKFKEFNKKYINMTGKISSWHVSKKIEKKYDYFICGSDQIWNPLYSGNTKTNFLAFTSKNKRIAYAPSFGISYIPNNRVEEFKKYLNGIDYLSCREEKGIEIIENITHKKAILVLDPTLLLDDKDWNKIITCPKFFPKKKYLLTYFLGSITQYTDYINAVAANNNLEIFDVMDMSNMQKFSTDPSEFLYLIKNADIICTDSFHGIVFSIIYRKTFISFNRNSDMENMNSRIESLFSLLSIPDRNYKKLDNKKISSINYDKIFHILDKEKKKSIDFLSKSLNIRS